MRLNATILFKCGDWVSHPVRIKADYEQIKTLLKTFEVSTVDTAQSAGAFVKEIGRTGFDTMVELVTTRDLSDYFSLTDNYKLFDTRRVHAIKPGYADDVYVVVLDDTQANLRVCLFAAEAPQARWFTVKR